MTLHTRRPRVAGWAIGLAVMLPAAALPAHAALAGGSHAADGAQPTVVLVHGAWADASSWRGVVEELQHDGYTVAAVANPLRSLPGDSAYVADFLATIEGPVVLAGHSYGGAVITNAATGNADVKALVYVNAFVPDQGQTVAPLAGPESALAVADPTTVFDFVPATLPPTPGTDIYLKTALFRDAFANGLSTEQAHVLAASQRPITLGALNEPSGAPAWETIPSWYLIGSQDMVIPPSAQRAMAEHAGASASDFRAGHLGLISDPKTVARLIEKAARATD